MRRVGRKHSGSEPDAHNAEEQREADQADSDQHAGPSDTAYGYAACNAYCGRKVVFHRLGSSIRPLGM